MFEWQGKKYDFDANTCYDHTGRVNLPDGTILRVTGWFESYPPKVAGLEPETWLPGQEPDTTPATLVESEDENPS